MRPLHREGTLTRVETAEERKGVALCTRCKRWLRPDRFTPDPRARSGLRSACRECHAAETAHNLAIRRNYLRVVPAPEGAPRCYTCAQEGKFLLVDGARACARHLRERAIENAKARGADQ